LDKKSVVAKSATTATDRKIQLVPFWNILLLTAIALLFTESSQKKNYSPGKKRKLI